MKGKRIDWGESIEEVKNFKVELSWWLSGKDSTCQCRRQVRSLAGEDSTCCGESKPGCHSYWVCALSTEIRSLWMSVNALRERGFYWQINCSRELNKPWARFGRDRCTFKMTHLAVEKLALVEELSVAFLRYELGRGDKDSVSVCCRNAVSIWSVLRTNRSHMEVRIRNTSHPPQSNI